MTGAGVDSLFTVNTTLDDRPIELVLSLASYADIAWVLQGAPPREEERVWMTQRLLKEIAAVDGQAMTVALAQTLLQKPRLLGDFVGARTRLYREARRRGLLCARCPSCGQGEVEVSFATLETRLRRPAPALTTKDAVWLPPPALASAHQRGRRHGERPLAAALRFEFPSYVMGLGARSRPSGGVLRALTPDVEDAAWQAHWPAGSFMPEDRGWWHRDNAAFVALLRYAAAVERFTGGGNEAPSLTELEELPAIDLAFLDFLVMATGFTDEPAPDAPTVGLAARPHDVSVTCPVCRARFLPLW